MHANLKIPFKTGFVSCHDQLCKYKLRQDELLIAHTLIKDHRVLPGML